jgi:hypothetical protein
MKNEQHNRRKLDKKQTHSVYETADADRKDFVPDDFLNRRRLEDGQRGHFQDSAGTPDAKRKRKRISEL